jgi:DNA-binding LytR/AlgR family response regulator
MIEDAGHIFAGFADSFAQLKIELDVTGVDGALVDIDLADGRTGPGVVAWLKERDIPCIFVTGQEEVAAQHADLAVAAIIKPVVASDLAAKIELFRGQRDT